MVFDNNGFIVMEQEGPPGNTGDSCAETSRYVTLCALTGETSVTKDLSPFVTAIGVLRYPTSPWRENDTSDDQVMPLIAASSIINPGLNTKVIAQLDSNGYKTGNGELIHPCTLGQIERSEDSDAVALLDLTILGQALLMKLPYRWNDSTNSFQSTVGSSSDYLNFINYLAFAKIKGNYSLPCRLAAMCFSASQVMAEIQSYYKPEPNNSMILDLYNKAIPQLFK